MFLSPSIYGQFCHFKSLFSHTGDMGKASSISENLVLLPTHMRDNCLYVDISGHSCPQQYSGAHSLALNTYPSRNETLGMMIAVIISITVFFLFCTIFRFRIFNYTQILCLRAVLGLQKNGRASSQSSYVPSPPSLPSPQLHL